MSHTEACERIEQIALELKGAGISMTFDIPLSPDLQKREGELLQHHSRVLRECVESLRFIWGE